MKAKRHILMELDTMQLVYDLADLGVSTKEIARRTGLSLSQAQYRVSTHAKVCQLEQGLRARWRNGNNPIIERMLADTQAIHRAEFKRQFLRQVVTVRVSPPKR